MQNFDNIAHRDDDDLIDSLAAKGITYVRYFPLGGFFPVGSDELASVATRLQTMPMAVALAASAAHLGSILLSPRDPDADRGVHDLEDLRAPEPVETDCLIISSDLDSGCRGCCAPGGLPSRTRCPTLPSREEA